MIVVVLKKVDSCILSSWWLTGYLWQGRQILELGNEDEGCKVVGNIYHDLLIIADGQVLC